MINGFAARKHDVATLKEALQIARAAIKDIQKDLCRRNVYGKKIEKRPKGRYDVEWQETDLPAFNAHTCDYRIKPESKYRPFKDAEECWQEMQKHQPFGWVKTDEGYEQIWHVNKGDNFNATLKTCTFADGTPFGIKEE